MRIAALLAAIVLAATLSAAAYEQPPEQPLPPAIPGPEPVTPEQRDESLKRALKVLDEDLTKRFSGYEQQGVVASAIAGWAFLLLEERGPTPDRVPSKALPPAKKPGTSPAVTPR